MNTNYDYDDVVNEYYNGDINSDLDNMNATGSCLNEEYTTDWNFIKGTIQDIWTFRRIANHRRLWKIIKVWFVIYLVVAVPFWCTRGWCCCCLFCKIFKPSQTINEAKRFLEANPPGVIQDKKGGVMFYESTRKERECYEKFGHLIRTI